MNKCFKCFFDELYQLSNDKKITFPHASETIKIYIENFNKSDLIELVKEIGSIPESIEASSSFEKLYSKASDYVLAKCFTEFGLPSIAVNERGNSADIVAKSIHGYTLVADAKTFRMSRTAKNQKDFKIATLSNWRGSEHDFAILVAPYFQYPPMQSQIYSSSLEHNVCLLSWEHILYLLINNVIETDTFSLENIWNAPLRISRESKIAFADRMNCQFPYINKMICDRISKPLDDFTRHLTECQGYIFSRSKCELQYLMSEKELLENLTREQAIAELLGRRKILERIRSIKQFVKMMS